MRLIDADAYAKTLRDISKRHKYEELLTKKDGFPTVADVIEAICQDLDGTATLGFKNAPTVEWKDIELMGYVNGEQITKIKPSKIEGHWEEIMRDFGYSCSICHYVSFKTNYCPNCGAKMKGAEND